MLSCLGDKFLHSATAFRSLEAYNQMIAGFIASVQGHIIADKFVVLAKVRHSQRINDSLISCWVITEREGTIVSAHCLGCKAGLAESCSYVASVLRPRFVQIPTDQMVSCQTLQFARQLQMLLFFSLCPHFLQS